MTKLTDSYTAFRALVALTLTGYNELPNPYNIEDNSSLFLRKGYGVAYGAGENTFRRATRNYSATHEFTVTLTTLNTATENNVTAFANVQATLFGVADTLIKAVEDEPTLGGKVANIDWVGYEQIEAFDDMNGTNKFISLPLNFRAEYFE